MGHVYTEQSKRGPLGFLHPSTTWVYRERTTSAESGKLLNASAGDMLHDWVIRSDHEDVICITDYSIRAYEDAEAVLVQLWSGDPAGSGVLIDQLTCDGDTGKIQPISGGNYSPLIKGDEPYIIVSGTTIKVDVFVMGRVMRGRKTP